MGENSYTIANSGILDGAPEELKHLFFSKKIDGTTWKSIDGLMNICMGSRSVLFTMLEHYCDPGYDFPTIKGLSLKWVDAFVQKLEAYSLREPLVYLSKMQGNLIVASSREDAYQALNDIQQYISKLFLWIDAFIPWKALCETYASVKGDKKPDD